RRSQSDASRSDASSSIKCASESWARRAIATPWPASCRKSRAPSVAERNILYGRQRTEAGARDILLGHGRGEQLDVERGQQHRHRDLELVDGEEAPRAHAHPCAKGQEVEVH